MVEWNNMKISVEGQNVNEKKKDPSQHSEKVWHRDVRHFHLFIFFSLPLPPLLNTSWNSYSQQNWYDLLKLYASFWASLA